jgi:hypothetical protein
MRTAVAVSLGRLALQHPPARFQRLKGLVELCAPGSYLGDLLLNVRYCAFQIVHRVLLPSGSARHRATGVRSLPVQSFRFLIRGSLASRGHTVKLNLTNEATEITAPDCLKNTDKGDIPCATKTLTNRRSQRDDCQFKFDGKPMLEGFIPHTQFAK